MIEPGLATPQAACDGDVITRTVLRALTAPRGLPRLPLAPTGRPAAGAPAGVPLCIARPSQATAPVREQAAAWLAARSGSPHAVDADGQLLHAVESAALVRPPVSLRGARLDAELAALYLQLARRWIGCSRTGGDHRYLNAAAKLVSAALFAPAPPALAAAALGETVEAIEQLHVPPADIGADARRAPAAVTAAGGGQRVRITVLAGESSRGLPLFLHAAAGAGVTVSGVVLHQAGPDPLPPGSLYASAWYPRPTTARAAVPPPRHPAHSETTRVGHQDWAGAAAAVRSARTDVLVLLGMDVVPPLVLDAPRLATVNAHNGALPCYRGMDAVAWAVLAGTRPVCSVHLATADVDAGDVLAQRRVPAGTGDLRQAVKDTQVALLTEVCSHTAVTGALPVGRPQTGTARRYYRMHPALRRRLDDHFASPTGGTP